MSAAKFDKLSDDNHIAWFKWMRAYLVKQEVWGIVSGYETKPLGSENSKAVKTWTRKRDVAAAEILLHVSEKYISHCNDQDPASTWERLRSLFHAQGQSSVAMLRRDFHSMMKTGDESMREWITRVDSLLYQLKELNSPLDDVDVVNTLTRGIGKDYDPLIVHFDSLLADSTAPSNPISIPYVIQRLMGEEKRLKTSLVDDIHVNYAGTQAKNRANHSGTQAKNPKSNARLCFHCGQEGHVRTECDVTPREVHSQKMKSQAGNSSSGEVQAKFAFAEDDDITEVSVL